MVSNAQLDNDKANLIYQVDTLKDVIEEMEEQMSEMKRELEDKSKVKQLSLKRPEWCYTTCHKATSLWSHDERVMWTSCVWNLLQELERQKHTCTVLQHKQEELKEGIRQRDELIEVRLRLTGRAACWPHHTAFLPTSQVSAETALCWNQDWSARSCPSLALFLLPFSSVLLSRSEDCWRWTPSFISFSATAPQMSVFSPCFACFCFILCAFSLLLSSFHSVFSCSVLSLHCFIVALLNAAPGEPANAD